MYYHHHQLMFYFFAGQLAHAKRLTAVLSRDTIVAASNSAQESRILSIFLRMVELNVNCPGYSSLAVCAHVVAACMKTDGSTS